MFRNIKNDPIPMQSMTRPLYEPSLYDRDEKEDIKKTLDLIFELKSSLSKLHPNCMEFVIQFFQERR